MKVLLLLTHYQFVSGVAHKTFEVFNPANEKIVGNVHEAGPEDVDIAVDAARKAFPEWSNLSAHERAAPMFKFAQLVLRDADEIAYLDSISMGKYVCGNFQINANTNDLQAIRAYEENRCTGLCRSVQLFRWISVPYFR